MKFIKIFFTSIILMVSSCVESTKEKANPKDESSMIEGFWRRTGMVRYVNGKPVDTLYYSSDAKEMNSSENFIQIKAFGDGGIFWMNNSKEPSTPWKGSTGGYGKYKIEKDTIIESISHGTGGFGQYMAYLKDSLNTTSFPFKFGYEISENNYVQKYQPNQEGISFAEFYEKLPVLQNSKMDGAWKRSYQITFVNGVAVDTTSVPSDAILDVKIIKDGYFLFQVDRTKLIGDPSKSEYGGTGGFGQIDYSNGNMVEYTEIGSGNWLLDTLPKSIAHYASIEFYDDDTFLQITKDTLNQMSIGRGLVYRRIQ